MDLYTIFEKRAELVFSSYLVRVRAETARRLTSSSPFLGPLNNKKESPLVIFFSSLEEPASKHKHGAQIEQACFAVQDGRFVLRRRKELPGTAHDD